MQFPDFFQKGLSKVGVTITTNSGRRKDRDITFGREGIKSINTGAPYGGSSMVISKPGYGKGIPADQAMRANTGWVYAAVKAIADEIQAMQFDLYQVKPNGEHEKQFEHDILDLLDGVNERQSGPEFKHLLGSHLELAGNAYILMQGVKNFTDKPTALYLLNPANMTLKFDKSQFPWVIQSYEFTFDGKRYTFKPYEILHVKYPDPNNEYDGLGTVQAIPDWIDLSNAAVEFNRQFFVRGSKTGPVFESDATDEGAIERLRTTYENSHAGVENSHRPLILPKGVTVPKNNFVAKDMDFGNLFDKVRDMILGGFRTGKTILGTAESDTNRATAETADYVFAKRTIKPKMQMIVAALNQFLVPRFGDDIYLSFLDPTPEDKNFRILEMQAVSGSQPVLSVNETRKSYLGVGPIENGDSVVRNNNMVEIGEPAADGPTVIPQKASRKRRPVMTQNAKNAKFRAKLSETLAENLKKNLEKIQLKDVTELSHEEYQLIWTKFVDRVTIIEEKMKEGMIVINNQQKQEVLKNIKPLFKDNEKGYSKKLQAKDIFSKQKWMAIVADFATPLALEIAKIESEAAGSIFGKPGIDITEDANAAEALDRSIALMAETYNQTTLDQLHDAIALGLKENSGYDNTAEVIQGIYEFADVTRATAVARTETFRVANYATKATWKQIGVKSIKWYTAEDNEVCPFCQTLDGKIINIDDNFFDKGDTVEADGKSMTLDYDDVGAPPLHVNCRCYQRPQDIGGLQ